MVENTLNINDDDFWMKPFDGTSDLIFSIMRKEKPKILIDGPKKTDYTLRKTLPVVSIRVASSKDCFYNSFKNKTTFFTSFFTTSKSSVVGLISGPAVE